MVETKTTEDLIRLQGRFYTAPNGYFCDTGADSWKYVESVQRFLRVQPERRAKMMRFPLTRRTCG